MTDQGPNAPARAETDEGTGEGLTSGERFLDRTVDAEQAEEVDPSGLERTGLEDRSGGAEAAVDERSVTALEVEDTPTESPDSAP